MLADDCLPWSTHLVAVDTFVDLLKDDHKFYNDYYSSVSGGYGASNLGYGGSSGIGSQSKERQAILQELTSRGAFDVLTARLHASGRFLGAQRCVRLIQVLRLLETH